MAIARLDINGQLDITFNLTGLLIIPFTDGNIIGSRIKLQNDGKIICSGRSNIQGGTSSGTLVRINANGTLDTSFGTNGMVTIAGNQMIEVLIDNSQNILVQQDVNPITPFPAAGQVGQAGQCVLKRFLPNGIPDSTFGINGIQTLSFLDGFYQTISNIISLPNGKYLVAGNNTQTTTVEKAFIARINNNGTLDTTFAGSGFININDLRYPSIIIDSNDKIFAIADKRIVDVNFNTITARMMLRYNQDGTPDTSFGTNRVFEDNISTVGYNCFTFQQDNKLVIAGDLSPGSGIARFTHDTLLNSSFNKSNSLSIHPNPTSGNFTIKIDQDLINANVSVYNIIGQNIKKFRLEELAKNQNLEQGIYILEIEKEGNKISRKLIVQ